MAVQVRHTGRLFAFDGQSLMLQPSFSVDVPENVLAALPALDDLRLRGHRCAIGGTTYAERVVDVTRRVDALLAAVPVGTAPYLFEAGGTAEVGAAVSDDPASILAAMESYWAARQAAGWTVIASTVPDSSTFNNATKDACLTALNTAIRASTVWDALADVVGDTPGLLDHTDTDLFFDGIHYTATAAAAAGDSFIAAFATL